MSPEIPYQASGGMYILFVLYVVLVLFTMPVESNQHLFEYSLPYTRSQIFMAKYISGFTHIIFVGVIFYASLFPIVYGFFDVYQFSFLLISLILITFYQYTFIVFFGMLYRKNIGAIIGAITLIAVQTVALALLLPLPPVPPISEGFKTAILISIVLLFGAFIIHRRVDL